MSFMIFFKFYTNYITYYWKNNYWQFFWNLGWHLIVKPWCYHLVSNEAVYFYKTKVNTHIPLMRHWNKSLHECLKASQIYPTQNTFSPPGIYLLNKLLLPSICSVKSCINLDSSLSLGCTLRKDKTLSRIQSSKMPHSSDSTSFIQATIFSA